MDPNTQFNNQLKTVTYQYDLQGRMKSANTQVSTGLGFSQNTVSYQYDSAGNRVLSESVSIQDTSNVGEIPVRTRTEYLTEDSNPTGYSQVLQETQYEVDANGDIVTPAKKTVYAIGHDQISQTVFVWDAGSGDWDAGDTHSFGTDGHGSVRVLWDAVAAIVSDAAAGVGAQIYHFDAYGNLLNFAGAVTPITSYLYSGESFDFNLGQQYLRARWYDATTGRFNRLDPFFGNSNDPQSFHKYAYVHGDPISGRDPSGKMIGIVLGSMIRSAAVGSVLGAGIGGVYSLFDSRVSFWQGVSQGAIIGALLGGFWGLNSGIAMAIPRYAIAGTALKYSSLFFVILAQATGKRDNMVSKPSAIGRRFCNTSSAMVRKQETLTRNNSQTCTENQEQCQGSSAGIACGRYVR